MRALASSRRACIRMRYSRYNNAPYLSPVFNPLNEALDLVLECHLILLVSSCKASEERVEAFARVSFQSTRELKNVLIIISMMQIHAGTKTPECKLSVSQRSRQLHHP